MELKIVWTPRAYDNYIKILDYIVENFGIAAGKNYNDKLAELIELVKTYPEIGAKQTTKNLRAIILFKRTSLFYSKKGKYIKIINIVDNRWEL